MMFRDNERSMAAGTSEQMPLTFDDIAVHFSEEEWDYLAEWQKDLHKNVMWENYEALTSLGFHVARPVVQLKSEQQAEVHIGVAAGGDAPIPNKLYSDTGGSRLPNRRNSSEVPKTVFEGQEIVAECPETAFPRNPKHNSIAVNDAPTITRHRTFINPAFSLQNSGCTSRPNQGAHNVSTPSPAARARSALKVFMKNRTADGSVEESRTESAFGEESESPRSMLEENTLGRNTMEKRSSPWSSEETTSGSSSSEERLRRSKINSLASDTSRARHPKRSSRTPRTMQLLLFQQRKIMRELQDLRRSNEQLQHSLTQVMQDLRRKPGNLTRLPAEACTLHFQDIRPVEDTSLLDSEICFMNCPAVNTSCQPAAQTTASQDAVNNVVSDESDKRHEILSFSFQQNVSPLIDNTSSSSASPLRHTGSTSFELTPEAMQHNANRPTNLTEALPGDFSCIPIAALKQEPDTVTVEPVLRTHPARSEKHGESLPDIPLAHLTAERQAILLRHSRGEPQTLAKFLFQHYVPFHVYETWVHTTNFDGSRNKRAIPRNLRTEILRFITSKFRLVKKDKKQIRDRINELLRMPRTGGWPVLN